MPFMRICTSLAAGVVVWKRSLESGDNIAVEGNIRYNSLLTVKVVEVAKTRKIV